MTPAATPTGLGPEPVLVAPEVTLVDLMFCGEPRSIASALLRTSSGIVVVDPGPTTTLDALERALEGLHANWKDVRAVLLTHLHLDHAGSAGTIARFDPGINVVVHASGAPHLADPARLLRSAAMIYGDDLRPLWGDVLPVPAGHIVPLAGGEILRVDGRVFAVAATPDTRAITPAFWMHTPAPRSSETQPLAGSGVASLVS
ncbi:MAG: MBL fold metallo-hydrolase [Acidobacteria bacterium]|nr:MBL fold metallo-hydrolase [Acidobacteriota bacterium]